MMHWDGTITLGTLLQIGTTVALAVALFNALSARLTVFEHTLTEHARALDRYDDRLGEHEELFRQVVRDLAGVIGRTESVRHDYGPRQKG